jgi:hypothetical protein
VEPKTKKILIVSGVVLSSAIFGFIIYKLIKRKMSTVYVQGEFKGANCDELHAFQSTSGRIIGGMNDKVFAELEKLYEKGINPEVTEVKVDMDSANMKVKWQVKIEPSKDGKAWVGFTSRGSSGGASAFNRAVGKAQGQDFDSVKKKISGIIAEPNMEMKVVKDYLYNFSKDGEVLGKCPTRQVFYAYTRPNKYPKK